MNEDLEIYGNSSSQAHAEKEVSFLNVSATVAFIYALYDTGLMIYLLEQLNIPVIIQHVTKITILISVAVWCRSFAGYKNCIKYGEFNYYSEYNMMKSISFVTGILCLLRIVALVFYFLQNGKFYPAYDLYVGSEMLLLLGMACFFFYFASDMKKKIKEISTRKEE